MRISDWSSDVCSSDLQRQEARDPDEIVMRGATVPDRLGRREHDAIAQRRIDRLGAALDGDDPSVVLVHIIHPARCRSGICVPAPLPPSGPHNLPRLESFTAQYAIQTSTDEARDREGREIRW